MLDNIPYQSVLDIGGSIGLAKKICIKSEVKTVFSIDPDRTFIEEFLECNDDSRFNIIGADMTELKKKIEDVFNEYIRKGICIDDLMASNGYYPLIVLRFRMLNAILYTNDKPDRTVYDKAKYIIQVNSSCNFDCPWCYVDKLGITMDEDTFHKILETVNKSDMISLRGGEPTLNSNLISKYIRPITRYLDIKDLPINGKFVDIYGNLHDRIAGILHSEFDKG